MIPELPVPTVTLPEAEDDRSLRRLLLAIKPIAGRIVRTDEHIIAVAEAVEVVDWRFRRFLGAGWIPTHRVALMFSNRRLLELGLSSSGRRTTGFVREHPWSSSLPPEVSRGTFSLGETHRWWLRRPLGHDVENEITRMARSGAALARRSSSALSWRLCQDCGVTAPEAGGNCQRCGSLRQPTRLAALLSLAIPGAGMRAIGRPVFAALRVITEAALMVLIAAQLLTADGHAEVALVVALGAVALLLVKVESMQMTSELSDRVGSLDLDRARAQRHMVPKGIVLSLAVILIPVLLAGVLSTEVTADLDADGEHLGWKVSRDPAEWDTAATTDTRAVWRHREGWLVRATARSMQPFLSPRSVRNRWFEKRQEIPNVTPKRFKLGQHRSIRALEVVPGDAGESVRLQYLILDEYGRDAHLLQAEVATADLESADHSLQQLIACLYWIPSTTP